MINLRLSEFQCQDFQIPNATSYAFALKYFGNYQLISPQKIDATIPIPANITNNQVLNIQIPNNKVQLMNTLISLDLIAFLQLPGKKTTDELIAIPLKSQKIEINRVIETLVNQKTMQTDICLDYNFEPQELNQAYPDYFPAELDIKPQQLQFNLEFEQIPDLSGNQIQFDLQINANEQITTLNDCRWQVDVELDNNISFSLYNGQIETIIPEEETILKQESLLSSQLNSQIQVNTPSTKRIVFPTIVQASQTYKQFQTEIQQQLIKFSQVFETDKTAKKKGIIIKFSQEAFEAFVYTYHNLLIQSPLQLTVTDFSQIKLKIEPKPILYKQVDPSKNALKKDALTIFGITRQNFVEVAEFDIKETLLVAQQNITPNQLKQQKLNFQLSLLPYDVAVDPEKQEKVEVETNDDPKTKQKAPPPPKENRKHNPAVDYQDGSLNRIYSNSLAGIDSILKQLDAIKQQSPKQQNSFHSKHQIIVQVLDNYLKNRTSQEEVKKLYDILNKLSQFNKIYSNQQQKTIIPSVEMKLFQITPIGIKFTVPEISPELQELGDEITNRIGAMARFCFNEHGQLLNQEPVFEEDYIQDGARNMLMFVKQQQFSDLQNQGASKHYRNEDQPQKKNIISKQFQIRGIQGIHATINQQYAQSSIGREKLDYDYTAFKNLLQAEGHVGIFMQDFMNYAKNLVSNGFTSETELINYFNNLVERVATQVHIEAQIKAINKQSQQQQQQLLTPIDDFKKKEKPGLDGKISAPLAQLTKNGSFNTAHVDAGGNLVSHESFLFNRGVITKDQKALIRFIKDFQKDIFLLTATNEDKFIKIALNIVAAIVDRFMETWTDKINFEDALEFLDDAGMHKTIANLIICRLVQGMKLAQPMRIRDYSDFDNYKKCIQEPLSMVKRFLACDGWRPLFNPQMCILTTCLLATENKSIQFDDAEAKVKASLNDLPYVQDSAPFELDHQYLKIIEPLILADNDLCINILWNHLCCPMNKSNETKVEVNQRLQQEKYHVKDLLLFFEIIGLSRPSAEQLNNGFIQKKINIEVDETGKKINREQQQAQNGSDQPATKQYDVHLQQPDRNILSTFLYLLHKMKLVSVKYISDLIKKKQLEIVEQFDGPFRKRFKTIEETLMIVDNPDNLHVNRSHVSRSIVSTSQMTAKNQRQQNYSLLLKLIAERPYQLSQYTNLAHLTCIQEYYLYNVFSVEKQLFQVSQFPNEDAFMEELLQSGFDGQTLQNKDSAKAMLLLNLAEFLLLRNEKFLAAEAMRFATAELDTMCGDTQLTLQTRIYTCRMYTLLLERNFPDVVHMLDRARNGEFGPHFNQKLKSFPVYGFIKAQALRNMIDSKTSPEDEQVINGEITRYCLQSIVQLQKVKDVDELQKGSSFLCETGFYSLQYGYTIVELFLFCSQIVKSIQGRADQKSFANDTEAAGPIGTNTDFLKSICSSKFATSKFKPSFGTKTTTQEKSHLKLETVPMIINNYLDAPVVLFDGIQEKLETKIQNEVVDQQLLSQFMKTKQNLKSGIVFNTIEKAEANETPINNKPEQPAKRTVNVKDIVRNIQMDQQENGVTDKNLMKQLLLLSGAIKQMLEQYPNFGPLWSIFSVVQLAMNNPMEAKFSGSLATLMNSYVCQDWICWVLCETIASRDDNLNRMKDEIIPQLEAMGADQGLWSGIWLFIKTFDSMIKGE